MKYKYKIAKTKAELLGILEVKRVSWLHTYVNQEKGVSEAMIKDHFKHKWTPAYISKKVKALWDKDKQDWIVYDPKDPQRIIGWMSCEKEADASGGFAIYILPEFQGQGIGSGLMSKGLSWLFETQRKVIIGVVEYNLKAMDFYRRFGFIITGEREDFRLGDTFVGKNWIVKMELEKVK